MIVQLSDSQCRQQSRHGEEIWEVQQLQWDSMNNNCFSFYAINNYEKDQNNDDAMIGKNQLLLVI